MSFMAALSTVASQRVRTASSDRTDQLRKRCHDMLQQRTTPTKRGNVHFQTVVFPPPPPSSSKRRCSGGDEHAPAGGADDRAAGAAEAPTAAAASFFFASVPRPREVHQTLVQATQNQRPKPPAEAGHPLCCGGTAAPPARGAHDDDNDDARAALPLCDHGVGAHRPAQTPGSPVTFDPRPGSPPPPPLRFSSYADAASDAELTLDGSAFTPLLRRTQPLPSMMSSAALPPPTPDETLLGLYDLRHPPRLSSSDLIFSSMACPVPVTGLLNLSDIHFRRSSEEMVAVSVLQELRTRK
jgi:hypothetical protein